MKSNCYRQSAWTALISIFLATAPCAQAQDGGADRYVRCSFYPQAQGCDQIYQQALHDQSPAAASVRAAFAQYARYLKPSNGGLTEDDKHYLLENEIRVPFDLNATDLAGLHNVIQDPGLAGNTAARRAAVNGFIAHAVQAELYCGLGDCRAEDYPPSS